MRLAPLPICHRSPCHPSRPLCHPECVSRSPERSQGAGSFRHLMLVFHHEIDPPAYHLPFTPFGDRAMVQTFFSARIRPPVSIIIPPNLTFTFATLAALP